MMRPRSLTEAENKMDPAVLEKLKNKQLRVMQKYLWNDEISAEKANKAIAKFNAEWLAAGGHRGDMIAEDRRHEESK